MNSRAHPKKVKGSYPKLMIGTAQSSDEGTIVLARRNSAENAFEGVVLHLGPKSGLIFGTSAYFAASLFEEFEGEVVLSN